ncbi:MAG TPA: hypothetical protein VLV17_05810 [Anaeromyxobacteraceae bacterium]|nr:hypothetical protein [Anaeromyxobacteraceae bacterium]
MRSSSPALLLVVLGCAPALHAPRPIEASPSAGESAPLLVSDARASFAKRPDLGAVRRAVELFHEAAAEDPAAVEGLVGAILAAAWLVEHDPDPKARLALASSSVDDGQLCLARRPAEAWCDYGLGIALGLQARERHATATEGLKLMAEHLRKAEKTEPGLDLAGPERVLALLLVRAPGWPVGPGDPEEGLAEARRAVALFPDHPPNQLALAEALFANGMAEEGRAAAQRALELAHQHSSEPDAPDWVRAAENLLARQNPA